MRDPDGTRDKITAAWGHYLGSQTATPYAAPARAEDLSGLPPAYVATAEFEPLRDEAVEYALRLLQAGVSVELHAWAGTFHGSHAILSADVSQRQIAELCGTLRRALRPVAVQTWRPASRAVSRSFGREGVL